MKIKLSTLWKSGLLSVFFSGCAQGPYPMGGGNHMMGYGYGGWFIWLLLLVIIVVIAYLVLNRDQRGGSSMDSPREDAREILKRRYAKGEITKEEFDRMKKEIE